MLDEAHAAHIAGQIVDLTDALDGAITALLVTKVDCERFSFVGYLIPLILRLDIHRTDVVSPCQQFLYEMAADETATSRNKNTTSVCRCVFRRQVFPFVLSGNEADVCGPSSRESGRLPPDNLYVRMNKKVPAKCTLRGEEPYGGFGATGGYEGDKDDKVGPMRTAQTVSRVEVLGVHVSAIAPEDVVPSVERWIDEGERQYVCVTGVHGVMESQDDPDLREIHNRSGLTVPDGMPMVWCGKFAGFAHMDRVYGPEMMLRVCARAAESGWSSFFYGGPEGLAELVAERMADRFPGLQIAGTYTPPFRQLTAEEEDEIASRIRQSGAELVWVGLSTPKQERWMHGMIERLQGPVVLFGVGAAFDLNAGLRPDAPQWMRKSGLHWLYRLLQEPKRLWRRYLVNNPSFVARILARRPRAVSLQPHPGLRR